MKTYEVCLQLGCGIVYIEVEAYDSKVAESKAYDELLWQVNNDIRTGYVNQIGGFKDES